MMQATFRIATFLVVFLYGILWVGGITSSGLWGEAPESASWAAPAFLYISSLLLLKTSGDRSGLLLLAVGVYGIGIEILGLPEGWSLSRPNQVSLGVGESSGNPLSAIPPNSQRERRQ